METCAQILALISEVNSHPKDLILHTGALKVITIKNYREKLMLIFKITIMEENTLSLKYHCCDSLGR